MNFEDFHKGVLNTLIQTDDHKSDVLHMVCGVSEEAGEIAGKFKRLLRGDPGADLYDPAWRDQVSAEIGDTLFYLDALASLLGDDLGEIAERTIRKLADRKARGVLTGVGDNR